jgi:hypothetical protein
MNQLITTNTRQAAKFTIENTLVMFQECCRALFSEQSCVNNDWNVIDFLKQQQLPNSLSKNGFLCTTFHKLLVHALLTSLPGKQLPPLYNIAQKFQVIVQDSRSTNSNTHVQVFYVEEVEGERVAKGQQWVNVVLFLLTWQTYATLCEKEVFMLQQFAKSIMNVADTVPTVDDPDMKNVFDLLKDNLKSVPNSNQIQLEHNQRIEATTLQNLMQQVPLFNTAFKILQRLNFTMSTYFAAVSIIKQQFEVYNYTTNSDEKQRIKKWFDCIAEAAEEEEANEVAIVDSDNNSRITDQFWYEQVVCHSNCILLLNKESELNTLFKKLKKSSELKEYTKPLVKELQDQLQQFKKYVDTPAVMSCTDKRELTENIMSTVAKLYNYVTQSEEEDTQFHQFPDLQAILEQINNLVTGDFVDKTNGSVETVASNEEQVEEQLVHDKGAAINTLTHIIEEEKQQQPFPQSAKPVVAATTTTSVIESPPAVVNQEGAAAAATGATTGAAAAATTGAATAEEPNIPKVTPSAITVQQAKQVRAALQSSEYSSEAENVIELVEQANSVALIPKLTPVKEEVGFLQKTVGSTLQNHKYIKWAGLGIEALGNMAKYGGQAASWLGGAVDTAAKVADTANTTGVGLGSLGDFIKVVQAGVWGVTLLKGAHSTYQNYKYGPDSKVTQVVDVTTQITVPSSNTPKAALFIERKQNKLNKFVIRQKCVPTESKQKTILFPTMTNSSEECDAILKKTKENPLFQLVPATKAILTVLNNTFRDQKLKQIPDKLKEKLDIALVGEGVHFFVKLDKLLKTSFVIRFISDKANEFSHPLQAVILANSFVFENQSTLDVTFKQLMDMDSQFLSLSNEEKLKKLSKLTRSLCMFEIAIPDRVDGKYVINYTFAQKIEKKVQPPFFILKLNNTLEKTFYYYALVPVMPPV